MPVLAPEAGSEEAARTTPAEAVNAEDTPVYGPRLHTGPRRNITQDIMSSYGQNPKSQFLRNVSANDGVQEGRSAQDNPINAPDLPQEAPSPNRI